MFLSESKRQEIIYACLDEMYRCSTPSTTWAEILRVYSDSGIRFYDKYEIAEEDYNRIKGKYSKRLDVLGRDVLPWFLLDYAPRFKLIKEGLK